MNRETGGTRGTTLAILDREWFEARRRLHDSTP
jgi:hypothetical protein